MISFFFHFFYLDGYEVWINEDDGWLMDDDHATFLSFPPTQK